MASINNIPVSAKLIRELSGTIIKPDAWTDGKHITVRVWSCYRSMGFKTDYQGIPVQYFELRIEGERPKCKQFSGNRFGKPVELFEQWRNDLLPYMPNAIELKGE